MSRGCGALSPQARAGCERCGRCAAGCVLRTDRDLPHDEAGGASDGVVVPGGAESDYGFVSQEAGGIAERCGWGRRRDAGGFAAIAGCGAGCDLRAERQAAWRRWIAALDELPENQREVFVAHEWMGKSFNEIAGGDGREREYAALAASDMAVLPASAGCGCRRWKEEFDK